MKFSYWIFALLLCSWGTLFYANFYYSKIMADEAGKQGLDCYTMYKPFSDSLIHDEIKMPYALGKKGDIIFSWSYEKKKFFEAPNDARNNYFKCSNDIKNLTKDMTEHR